MASSAPNARPSVLVIHGPNLNWLGQREPEIYGRLTLAELDAGLARLGDELGVSVKARQSNGEGEIVTLLQTAPQHVGVIINPGGYTHTSVAITDAIRALTVPVVEVHLSNLYGREPMRHVSVTGAACEGVIMGLGPLSYQLALRYLAERVSTSAKTASRGSGADAPAPRGP